MVEAGVLGHFLYSWPLVTTLSGTLFHYLSMQFLLLLTFQGNQFIPVLLCTEQVVDA